MAALQLRDFFLAVKSRKELTHTECMVKWVKYSMVGGEEEVTDLCFYLIFFWVFSMYQLTGVLKDYFVLGLFYILNPLFTFFSYSFSSFLEEVDNENSIIVFRNFYDIHGGRPLYNWLSLRHENYLLSYTFNFKKYIILFCFSSVYVISSMHPFVFNSVPL